MRVDGHTRFLGLIGHPVGHSLSPSLHNGLAAEYKDNLLYGAFSVEEGDVEAALSGAYALGYQGLNITVPYKSQVMPYLASVAEDGAFIGAVNTLRRGEKGWEGHNTDWSGLLAAMDAAGIPAQGREWLLLGAGGAAAAAAYAAGRAGAARLHILNRGREAAEALAERANALFGRGFAAVEDMDWLAAQPMGSLVGIQATSVGLAPNAGACPLEGLWRQAKGEQSMDMGLYGRFAHMLDMIFAPEESLCLSRVRAAMAGSGRALEGRVSNGLPMLVFQGMEAYGLWTGRAFDAEERRHTLARMEAGKPANVVLLGFMGCGKSWLGPRLAQRLGRPFVDMDAWLEAREGRSVRQIFAEKGESYFREREAEAFGLLMERRSLVIAAGGGLPKTPENRRRLEEATALWIDTPWDLVEARLRGDTGRPLLDGGWESVRSLYEQRLDLYRQVSHMRIQGEEDGERMLQILLPALAAREAELSR